MDKVTRRRFLITSGVVAGGALAAGATAYTLWDILATADEAAVPPGTRTLVVLTLYGGNDGLATVIPFADPAYPAARPELAYSADQVLRLDNSTGLNPSLKGLHQMFGEDKLAIVRGVGYPQPDRSHFRSMDIWQTAAPERPGNTGWLGRWLDTVGGDPRLAVSFEPVLPPLLAGETSAGAAVPVTNRAAATRVGVPREALVALGAVSAGEPALQARAAACFADLIEVDEMITDVKEAAAAADGADSDDDTPAATGTGGGASPLAAQLDLVAQCVEVGVMSRVFSVSLGGFDFHASENVAQERLLAELDTAVSGFLTRMGRSERGRGVVLLIYSEFGRRVAANASDGTDHGTASNVMVAGTTVNGGLIGAQPSLTDLDRGDLKYATDFRDIYAAMLVEVLGADPGRILNGWTGRHVGLLRS